MKDGFNMRTIHLTEKDLIWPFDGEPYFKTQLAKTEYQEKINIQAFPCYSFDLKLVNHVAEYVENCFSIGFPCDYYVLDYDVIEGVNGYASRVSEWNDGKEVAFEPYIVLAGKKTPIHPAMQRYLIGHERGHVINYWLSLKMGMTDEEFDKHYADIREIDYSFEYGGKKWHTNTGEIMANDFRVLVCGLETDFWPHDAVHPFKCESVIKFWGEMKEKYAIA